MSSRSPKAPWIKIRESLSPQRAGLLMLLSFLAPLVLWAVVSYIPFIWHPDYKLQISADRAGVTTVYTEGDHLSKGYFPEFVGAVRSENKERLAARAAPGSPGGRRDNQKILRHLAPAAIRNGWLSPEQKEDDRAIYQVWKGVARGDLKGGNVTLSQENLEIVRHNWELLAAGSETFDFQKLPDRPLLKLVPQAVLANPVYLPAPHEVAMTGYHDFTAKASGDKPTMWARLLHSIKIVFAGFLISCVMGIPLGILCGTYDFVSKLCEPFVDFFRYMPAPAFATLLVAVFAAADAPKIALVVLGTVFQMVLVVSKTTRQLDRSLLEAAQTLGAKPMQLLGQVVIPGILPNLYNDLRILLGWSWTWLVIAELIGVKSGLTEFIETQGRWRNFDSVWPVIILIGVVGFVTDQLLGWFRGILFPYVRERGRRSPVTQFIAGLFRRKARSV